MQATVSYATPDDFAALSFCYTRPAPDILKRKISSREVMVAKIDNLVVGLLTYTLLYDTIPFVNELWVAEEHRRHGIGTQLVAFFESEARRGGATQVMTSSQADEDGQHFWRTIGFSDAGGVLLPGQSLEIFFRKDLR
ncbi:MAG: GNAT family N-acetyltransferase [Chitinivibrionales bacterium]|nr:GNAT family N-acetyltransferase [Chitinivibrionales bacterium]